MVRRRRSGEPRTHSVAAHPADDRQPSGSAHAQLEVLPIHVDLDVQQPPERRRLHVEFTVDPLGRSRIQGHRLIAASQQRVAEVFEWNASGVQHAREDGVHHHGAGLHLGKVEELSRGNEHQRVFGEREHDLRRTLLDAHVDQDLDQR